MLTLDEVLSCFPEPKIRTQTDWRLTCPFHDDKNPSLYLSITKLIFHCFGCGKKGTIYDLADHFGLQYEVARKENYISSVDSYALLMSAYGLTKETIDTFKIEAIEDKQAWRYPVAGGYRYKSFHRGKSQRKYWSDRLVKNQLYGISNAISLMGKSAGEKKIYIVNGEPAVWANTQAGVPAVCKFGENTPLPSNAAASFKYTYGITQVYVVYDKDKAGEEGALNIAAQLKQVYKSSGSVHVLKLPDSLPEKADTNDLYRSVGFDDKLYKEKLFSLEEDASVKNLKREFAIAVVDLAEELGIEKLFKYNTEPPQYYLQLKGRKGPIAIDSKELEMASAFQRIYREYTNEVIDIDKNTYRMLLKYIHQELMEEIDAKAAGNEDIQLTDNIIEIINGMGEVNSFDEMGHDKKLFLKDKNAFAFKQSYLTRKLRDNYGKSINASKLGVLYVKTNITSYRHTGLRYLLYAAPSHPLKDDSQNEMLTDVKPSTFSITAISNIELEKKEVIDDDGPF